MAMGVDEFDRVAESAMVMTEGLGGPPDGAKPRSVRHARWVWLCLWDRYAHSTCSACSRWGEGAEDARVHGPTIAAVEIQTTAKTVL